MHEIGQGSVPTGDSDVETFTTLRLAEPAERVKITLDERMLSIQGKRQATFEVRINAIHTMKHYSTNLAPAWMLILGFAMLWIGYRLMVPPLYRLAFIGAGSAMILARFITKQPTLAMQTTSGDNFVVHGNERTLNRLSFMFHHLANGKSMLEARQLLAAIQTGNSPDWSTSDVLPAPELPVVIHTPKPVERFLATSEEGEESTDWDLDDIVPEWTPTHEPEHGTSVMMPHLIPTYFAAQTTATANNYPEDHSPTPVNRPVLVPFSPPPMHQGEPTERGAQVFFPSFMNRDEAHIPGMTPPSEEVVREEPLLDEQQVLDAEDVLDAELVESVGESEAPTVHRESLLTPRPQRTIEDTMFEPRRARSLRPNASRTEAWANTLRSRSEGIINRLRPAQRPRPFATSETSGALREQAESSRPEPAAVISNLSEANGGVLDADETARLKARTEQILAAASTIQDEQAADLDSLSFSDLQPSRGEDETVDVPRLDED